jgi:hypothetical protein
VLQNEPDAAGFGHAAIVVGDGLSIRTIARQHPELRCTGSLD